LIFGALIFVHELGHYLTARIFHVSVKEFAIGMGPKILTKKSKKTGIDYSLRLLPIGGFVSMAGEDEQSDDPGAINHKPIWQRFIVMSAGSLMNLITGIIIMCALIIATPTLGSTTILRFADEGATSEASGLQIGDTITKIGGTSVHISYEIVYEIMRNGIEPLDITVKRNGETVVVKDVIFPTTVEEGVTFGSTDFYVAAETKTPLTVLKHSFYQSTATIKLIWESLFDLVTGRYGVDQVSGPVGVTTAIGEAAKAGAYNLLYLCVLISMNLGIFNLLPLPALDGGRLVFLVIEAVRGKPVKPEYEGYVHFAGIVVLMLAMVFITYKDIMKLFIK
jgi:Predicted membrane-associated Zn-dependent proteases 1